MTTLQSENPGRTPAPPEDAVALGSATLPFSREAEEAVLGALLLDGAAIADVVEVLKPEDFHVRPLSILYRVLLELFERSTGVDLTIVGERLLQTGEMERVGGAL